MNVLMGTILEEIDEGITLDVSRMMVGSLEASLNRKVVLAAFVFAGEEL